MPETFDIGLGNNNPEIRNQSETDFVAFWENQAKTPTLEQKMNMMAQMVTRVQLVTVMILDSDFRPFV